MKRNIILTGLMFLMFTAINAQVLVQDKTTGKSSGADGDIRFGPKAGLNLSSFINRDNFDITPKIGAYVGGLAEIPITDEIYGQPEVIVSFQGGDIGPGNLNLVYLHLPLMGKYHITDAIAVEFGPQIGFVLWSNANDYGGVTAAVLEARTFQAALNFGGGYRLDENLYFQARFSLGLTKSLNETSIKNGVFQIGGCYFF